MFCSKCGKKILDGDVFCPGCGTRIEWARFEEPKASEDVFEEEPKPVQEKFDFNWNLEDFNRKKESGVKIEWGDLLGIEERKENAASKAEAADDELSKIVMEEKPVVEEKMPSIDDFLDLHEEKKIEPVKIEEIIEPELPPRMESLRFDTFNRKNQEFQALLDKERERVRKTAEEQAMVADEIDQWAESSNVDLEQPKLEREPAPEPVITFVPETPEKEEEPEEAVPEIKPAAAASAGEGLSFFERRRKRKEDKKAILAAVPAPAPASEPLMMDENDIGGEWNEEIAPEEEEPVQVEAVPEVIEEIPAEEEIPVVDEEPIDIPEIYEELEEPEVEDEPEQEKEPEEIVEEEPEPEAEEEDPFESMLAADAITAPARQKTLTQKISRDEFSDFLRSVEAQFGLDEPEEDEMPVIEEPVVLEEPEPVIEDEIEKAFEPEIEEEIPAEPEPEVAEQPEAAAEPEILSEPEPEMVEQPEAATEPEIPAEPEPVKDKKNADDDFKLGEFKDDSFWDDEDSKKGSGFGTFLIALLAIILVAQIAILVIRFQFPDTGIAHMIEPKLTVIEQWIRGLFS